MGIYADRKQKLVMLEVFYEMDKEGKNKIKWNYGDRPNSYFLLGVLDVIKDELIKDINAASPTEETKE